MLLCVVLQTCNIHRDNARVIPLYFTVHLNAPFKERISFDLKDVHWGSRGGFTFKIIPLCTLISFITVFTCPGDIC